MATKDQKLTTTFILLFVTVFFCMFHQTVAFVFSLNSKRNDNIKRTTTRVSTTLDAALRSPLRTRCSRIHCYYRLYRSPHLLYNNQGGIISLLPPLFLARKRYDFGGGPLEENNGRNFFFQTREFEKSTLPTTEFEYDPIIPLEPEDNTISFFRNDGNGYNDNGGEKNAKKKQKQKQINDNDMVYTEDWDYEDDIDYQDYYYDDNDDNDDDDVVMDATTSIKRGTRNQREGGGRTRTQDIYDEDENDENDTGNFWTNPVGGMDFRERQARNKQRPSTRRTFPPPKTFMNDAKRTQRKTFRSGNPPPPNIIKEFYDRLFWYGFDPDETTSAADRTMFGGTRGKFDGLGLLQDIEEEEEQSSLSAEARYTVAKGKRNRRLKNTIIKGQKRPKDDFYDSDDYYDDDEWLNYDGDTDNYNDDNFVISDKKRNISRPRKSYKVKDDFDDAYDLDYDMKEDESTMGRRRPRKSKKRLDVSNWFQEEDEEEDYAADNDNQDKSSKSGGKLSPIVNILDNVFQIDADQVKYQAEDYNRRLGLDRKARFSSDSTPSSSYTGTATTAGGVYYKEPRKRRKGYAYRYVVTSDKARQEMDDSSWLLDQPGVVMDDDNSELKITNTKEQEKGVIDVDATVQIDSSTTRQNKQLLLDKNRQQQKEQSWEERAAAYERVPPKGILAWGPEGEMEGGIDARTYAAKTAMEEILTARNVFEKKEAIVSEAEKELLQLKKEASIQKKLLLSMEDRRKLPIIRDRLRMINFDIEDAARQLRRAKAEALAAIDKLESIELRHWALLRQYEADQELEERQRLQLPNNNVSGK